MSNMTELIGNNVYIELTKKSYFKGILTDVGSDILVLYDGQKFFYIPWLHVRSLQLNSNTNDQIDNPIESSLAEETESISYRKILTNAKGMFTEISVIGNLSFHGYVLSVLSDYFVFYSPVFNTMYISLSHLKWITPYNKNITPYTLSNTSLPVNPSNTPLLRSFEDQLKKVEGKLVVIDGGGDPMKIGLLKNVKNNLLEIAIASGETVYLKLTHVKSLHLPNANF
ncbi:DUF2642 domain-containing protein [Peribacillus loiseleuriae]|uniref:DUF2642 domain-containing protein n=1 Tax=Peribacillus loiseleuriae TaxID=1679170 RepID=UPI0037F3833E